MDGENSRLNELADRSAQKNGGTSAHYITANQALRDDLVSFMGTKFDKITSEIAQLRNEITQVKTELVECKTKLSEASNREKCLLQKVSVLENANVTTKPSADSTKEEFNVVGSSILREVKGTDIINGVVKSIPGDTINDVKKYISEHKNKPKNIITQIGGNDLDNDGTTVESVTTQYELLLTETKNKFPESNVIISGLPPRFGNELIRTKVKDFNRNMKAWSEQNEITYIDNEPIFEFRNSDVDVDSYVMHGEMPA